MKRKILAMTLLLAIVASMLVFAACKDDEPDEPKKLLGGFLSSNYESNVSIPSATISCAYESDRFVFDIDDVTLTFYILAPDPGVGSEEQLISRYGKSYTLAFGYTNSQEEEILKTIETVNESLCLEKYLSTDAHPRGFEKEITIPGEVFAQESGNISFNVLMDNPTDFRGGAAIIYYTKESEDTVRLSAYEAPVYLPGLMY